MKIKKKERKIKVLIVGAGKIGREYLKILNYKKKFEISAVLATSNKNLKEVNILTKKRIFTTEKKNIFKKNSFDLAIIAVPVHKTYKVSMWVMKHVKTLLIEKPPSLKLNESIKLLEESKIYKNNLFIALNRSYFESTILAKDKLKNLKDKRIVEVTDQENVYNAKKAGHKKIVLDNWMYANSIHMIDYFRVFCRGYVKKIIHLDKINSTFEKKVFLSKIIFSSGDIGIYKAFWNLPSRWQVKIITKNLLIDLYPLEKISIFIDNKKSKNTKIKKNKFKDGFLNQINDIEKFFLLKKNKLVTLKENLKTLNLIKKLYF